MIRPVMRLRDFPLHAFFIFLLEQSMIRNSFVKRLVISLSAVLLVSFSSVEASQIVFEDDFDGNQTMASGVVGNLTGITTTESVQNYAGIGNGSNQFGGNFLRNITGGIPSVGTAGAVTTLELSNLPPHTSISLDFLLATIDSWDGIDGLAGATGDYFNVHVDGTEVFEATFAQLSGNAANAYQAPSGGELSVGIDLFGIAFINDGAYDMGLEPALSNIPHTSSTLVIDFFADGPGWQGERAFASQGLDESWAIENLRVTVVPEPASLQLILIAVGALVTRFYRSR